MSAKVQKHEESETSPQLTQKHEIEGQGPVTEQASPAAAAQRAMAKPGSALGPADILSLQRAVGNQAVERMIGSVQPSAVALGTIQRHISPGTQSLWTSAHSQEAAAIEEIKAAHDEVQSGLQNVRGSANNMNQAFNAMQAMARAAQADPIQCPESGSPTGGFGEEANEGDRGEEVVM